MAHTIIHSGRADHVNYQDEHEQVAHDAETRQRERYGGFNFGAAFFGWVVASGIAVLLAAILSAAGLGLAISKLQHGVSSVSSGTAQTIGIVGGIALLVVLAIAYYAGGYVAGRMSRYDGGRQGLGAWIIGIVIALILGLAGAIFGAKYNVLQALNLPHIPIKAGSLTAGGLVTTIAALIVTFVAATSGGKVGERYHRKVDRIGEVAPS